MVVTSVANEYAGYCTTPPEYSAQFYEGGHTLYGPRTLDFLADCVVSLAVRLAGATPASPAGSDVAAHRTVELAVRRYLPRPVGRAVPVRSVRAPRVHAVGDVEWRWSGPASGDVRWHEPLVTVEVDGGRGWAPLPQPGGRALDACPGARSVIMLGPRPGEAVRGRAGQVTEYAVRWHAAEVGSVPAPVLPGAVGAPRYRFRLMPASGVAESQAEPVSRPF